MMEEKCCGGQEAEARTKTIEAVAVQMTAENLKGIEVSSAVEMMQANEPEVAGVWAQLCLSAKRARGLLECVEV